MLHFTGITVVSTDPYGFAVTNADGGFKSPAGFAISSGPYDGGVEGTIWVDDSEVYYGSRARATSLT